jgi:hypothetical protein
MLLRESCVHKLYSYRNGTKKLTSSKGNGLWTKWNSFIRQNSRCTEITMGITYSVSWVNLLVIYEREI